jgi:hypothetical protein
MRSELRSTVGFLGTLAVGAVSACRSSRGRCIRSILRVTPGCSFSKTPAGQRPRGVEREYFRGEKTQERNGRRFRATVKRRERTRKRRKTSRRVKPVERAGHTIRDPGRPGRAPRCRERGPIVMGGVGMSSFGTVPGKPVVIRPRAVQLSTQADNREGVCGPERGWRLLRGEDSGGKSSRNG